MNVDEGDDVVLEMSQPPDEAPAAVAAGAYADVPTAAKQMGKVRRHVYLPDEGRAASYDALFEHYLALHDHFGRTTTTMRRLKAIRRDAVARRTHATGQEVSA